MTDIKETTTGLYFLKTYLASKAIEEHGLARESLIGMQKVVDSAVNLLKEREAKPMLEIEDDDLYAWSPEDISYYCPRPECGKEISYDYNFCPYCGQEVKWDD